MSIFVQSTNSKRPKTEILVAINKVNFAWEENLPHSLQYQPIHLLLKPIHLKPIFFFNAEISQCKEAEN